MDRTIEIIFTHDLHSRFDPVKVERNGISKESGGFARIKRILDDRRSRNGECLVADAGDFSMGTLYQTIYAEQAPELRMLGAMGFEVTTIGNHEFDYRGKGFANMLSAAVQSGERLPCITVSNIDWPRSGGEDVQLVKEAMERYGVKPYEILIKNGYKIAVFGLMGQDADSCAPLSGLAFENAAECAARLTAQIRAKEAPDLVVCLSHGGTWENKKLSEDEQLAARVSGIDVIISGHSHTTLPCPLQINGTIIASSGEYGKNVGAMKLQRMDNGRWILVSYELIPVDESVVPDMKILGMIEGYREKVQRSYLSRFGYRFDQVLARSPFPFTPVDALQRENKEDPLGNLIADSYIHAVEAAEQGSGRRVDMAVLPAGVIRDSIESGDITVSDVFNISSLGIGEDGVPGYPLVSVYLTGREIRAAAEVDASISSFMSTAQLYMSRVTYHFNPNRLPFNKATDIRLYNERGASEKLQDNRLYRVAAGLYTAQMLGMVKAKSHGLLSIIPKDRHGVPVTDFSKVIIRNSRGEIKEWTALAAYLSSFPKDNGIPVIPDYYRKTHCRKVRVDSLRAGELLKQPNRIGLAAYGAAVGIVSFAALIRLKRKRRKDR